MMSANDSIQSSIKTYELQAHLDIFCYKKSSKRSKLFSIESLTFLFFVFSTVVRPMNILQPRCLSLVQRHIVLRRPPSVGMPRHALRRRMPNIRISAVAARFEVTISWHLGNCFNIHFLMFVKMVTAHLSQSRIIGFLMIAKLAKINIFQIFFAFTCIKIGYELLFMKIIEYCYKCK